MNWIINKLLAVKLLDFADYHCWLERTRKKSKSPLLPVPIPTGIPIPDYAESSLAFD